MKYTNVGFPRSVLPDEDSPRLRFAGRFLCLFVFWMRMFAFLFLQGNQEYKAMAILGAQNPTSTHLKLPTEPTAKWLQAARRSLNLWGSSQESEK